VVDSFLIAHRAAVTSLAARHRLPAVYPFRYFTEVGGLCPTEAISSTIIGARRRIAIAS
jgi:hypothetical protein